MRSIVVAGIVVALGLSSAQTDWTKFQNNPVMVKDTTIQGLWEWAAIGQPSFLFENDTFKMWYAAAGVAYPGDSVLRGRIGFARSSDGSTWVKRTPLAPVLDVGEPGTWDSRWCDTPAPLFDGTEYYLYYYGDSQSVVHSALGAATSSDGISWTRYAGNPILERGELLEWDGFWIESPAVLYDSLSGVYSMWYTGVGWGPGKPGDTWIRIGYAYSDDGLIWQKDTLHNPVLETGDPGEWDDGWVAVPGVRRHNGLYEMWYCGASCTDWMVDSTLDTGRVGYATSLDGITWTKYSGNPVLSTFDLPVDSGGPWAPDVILDGSGYHMWYETATGINYATAPINGLEKQDDNPQPENIRIFPNPFNNRLTIVIDQARETEIAIYDVAGRLVRKLGNPAVRLTGCFTWDGSDRTGRRLPAGVYIIRITCRTGTDTFKVLFLR